MSEAQTHGRPADHSRHFEINDPDEHLFAARSRAYREFFPSRTLCRRFFFYAARRQPRGPLLSMLFSRLSERCAGNVPKTA